MKKIGYLAAVIALSLSSTAYAKNGVYVGFDFAFSNQTEMEVLGLSATEDNDSGYNFIIGYQSPISDSFDVALEAEYRILGDAEFANDVKFESSAFFVNVKPKLYVGGENFFLAGLFGLGSVNVELSHQDISASEADIGYQLGFEAGYETNYGLGLNLGYKMAAAEIDSVDFTIDGFYAGLSYHF